MAMANRIELPEGVTWGGGNMEAGLDEDLQSMLFAGLVSIIFIYLLMGWVVIIAARPLLDAVAPGGPLRFVVRALRDPKPAVV